MRCEGEDECVRMARQASTGQLSSREVCHTGQEFSPRNTVSSFMNDDEKCYSNNDKNDVILYPLQRIDFVSLLPIFLLVRVWGFISVQPVRQGSAANPHCFPRFDGCISVNE